MNKCLVTKLNRVINNDLMPKVGELRLSPKEKATLYVANGYETALSISTDGVFTDSSFIDDKGKTASVINNDRLYIKDSSYLSIIKKYNIMDITFDNFNIDFSMLKYLPELTKISLGDNTIVNGEIDWESNRKLANIEVKYGASIDTNCGQEFIDNYIKGGSRISPKIQIMNLNCNSPVILPDMSGLTSIDTFVMTGTNIYGNVEIFKNLINLNTLKIATLNISGDVGVLSNLRKLKRFAIYNTKLSGDINVINNFDNINELDCNGTYLIGDISNLHSSFKYLKGGFSSFSWKNERPTSSTIISLNNVKLDNDVDAMLINQAKCVGSSDSEKSISVIGNRTDISDTAVETLQSKGYTVSITLA